jgi:phenylpropionate dioxygenase-like ring-hydroxylating dioxygenase large terminal subunit
MSTTTESVISVKKASRKHIVSGVIRDDVNYSTVLPREYYVSQEIFEKEFEKIFSKQWFFVGHTSQIPNIGDYFVEEFVGESIVIVRESAERVSGYLNVCRHRGHNLCSGPSGNIKRFVCPYHYWSYSLDGSLQHIPGNKDGEQFDYSDWRLRPVRVEVFYGFVFACLDVSQPATISEAFSEISNDLRRADTVSLKEIKRESYDIEANWKTLLENYLECFHCQGSHPTLCRSIDLQETYATNVDWPSPFFTGPSPLRPGVQTVSLDGKLVSKPLGEFANSAELPDQFGTGFGISPLLTRGLVQVDHVIVHTTRPIDAGRVRWETRWYVNSEAVEGTDYQTESVVAAWETTNREDASLCQGAYRGVKSRWFTPGPLDQREAAVPAALQAYVELMQSS